jgi:ABC-type phosphate transport system permease subunit
VSLGFFEGGLIEVAISLTIPITIANGIIVPVYACKRLHIPVMRYFLQVLPGPTLCAAVFAAVLLLSRILLDGNDALCLGTGLLAGSMVIGLLYWRFVLPASMKDRLRQRLGGAPQSSVPANR